MLPAAWHGCCLLNCAESTTDGRMASRCSFATFRCRRVLLLAFLQNSSEEGGWEEPRVRGWGGNDDPSRGSRARGHGAARELKGIKTFVGLTLHRFLPAVIPGCAALPACTSITCLLVPGGQKPLCQRRPQWGHVPAAAGGSSRVLRGSPPPWRGVSCRGGLFRNVVASSSRVRVPPRSCLREGFGPAPLAAADCGSQSRWYRHGSGCARFPRHGTRSSARAQHPPCTPGWCGTPSLSLAGAGPHPA